MASYTAITKQWVSTAPQVKLVVTEGTSTDTSLVLNWTLYYVASYAASTNGVGRDYTVKIGGSTVKTGTYNINGKTGTLTVASGSITLQRGTSAKSIAASVSFLFDVTWSGVYGGTKSASTSFTLAKKTSYTVTYDANGGSGAPEAQTKWHDSALTLSETKPTRTGYTFLGWSTSKSATSATYQAKGTLAASVNKNTTLYAVWKIVTYKVTYDANGGSGAPAEQTKNHGSNLTLRAAVPTLANYTFLGWSTTATATSATYQAGGTYTADKSVTLYAVWELAYMAPRITSFSAARCTDADVLDEYGNCAQVACTWESDLPVTSIVIEWKLSTESNWTGSKNVPVVSNTGLVGSVHEVIGGNKLSTDNTYDIRITITDSSGYTPFTVTLAGTAFLIDFRPRGVAVGKPAEVDDLFDVAYQTRLGGGLLLETLDGGVDLDTLLIPNVYRLSSTRTYPNAPETNTGGILEILGDGAIMQRWTSAAKANPETYVRFYYEDAWGSWIEADKVYKPGDVITSTGTLSLVGYTWTTGDQIRLFIPLAKPAVGCSAVAISGGTWTVLQGGVSHVLTPTNFNAALRGGAGNFYSGINLYLTFSDTTLDTRTTYGVHISGATITFT